MALALEGTDLQERAAARTQELPRPQRRDRGRHPDHLRSLHRMLHSHTAHHTGSHTSERQERRSHLQGLAIVAPAHHGSRGASRTAPVRPTHAHRGPQTFRMHSGRCFFRTACPGDSMRQRLEGRILLTEQTSSSPHWGQGDSTPRLDNLAANFADVFHSAHALGGRRTTRCAIEACRSASSGPCPDSISTSTSSSPRDLRGIQKPPTAGPSPGIPPRRGSGVAIPRTWPSYNSLVGPPEIRRWWRILTRRT